MQSRTGELCTQHGGFRWARGLREGSSSPGWGPPEVHGQSSCQNPGQTSSFCCLCLPMSFSFLSLWSLLIEQWIPPTAGCPAGPTPVYHAHSPSPLPGRPCGPPTGSVAAAAAAAEGGPARPPACRRTGGPISRVSCYAGQRCFLTVRMAKKLTIEGERKRMLLTVYFFPDGIFPDIPA